MQEDYQSNRRGPDVYEMDKRLALVEQSQKEIKNELCGINANTSKLVWIVISAVVVGLLNMYVKFGASL
jgi:hypothetical protein